MKLSSVKLSPMVSFKGIKGGVNKNAPEHFAGQDSEIIKNYYPFKDESKEEVDKFIRANTTTEKCSFTEREYTNSDDDYYYDDNNMRVYLPSSTRVVKYSVTTKYEARENLPFTKDEYNKYCGKKGDPSDLPMSKRLEIKNILEEIEREKSL